MRIRRTEWFPIFGAVIALGIFASIRFADTNPGDSITNLQRAENVFRIRGFQDVFREELDPMHPDTSIFVAEQIYDGLVSLDRNLNFVPNLAEYWDASYDGKRYSFYIRKNVFFHHGEELTAEDVKYSFERLLDPRLNSPYAQFFVGRVAGLEDFRAGKSDHIRGFVIKDRYTFEIHWTKPVASALYLLSMHFCKILPKSEMESRESGFFRRPSGTGPFRFDSWIRDNRLEICGIRMVRNEAYFLERPRLDALEFCPFYTLDNFIQQDIDSIPVLSERLLESNYQILRDGSIHPFYLGMSCHRAPLNDPLVRKAIFNWLNKSEIILKTYGSRYERQLLHSYIPPQLPGFFLTDEIIATNRNDAIEFLGQAGYNDENPVPEITLFLESPRNDFNLRIYRELRNQLSELGISLRLNYYRSIEEVRSYQRPYLILLGKLMSFPDPDEIIRLLFHSESPANLMGFKNQELDTLLQNAEIPHLTRRNKLFREIEQILFREVPAVPLFTQQNLIAMQPYIRGIESPPLGIYYLKTNKLWMER